MYEGTIIVLNGVSSSGKTSIAREIQQYMDEPFMHLSIDNHMSSILKDRLASFWSNRDELCRFISGFHKSVATYAHLGNRIVLDVLFEIEDWFDECHAILKPYNTIYIGVHCQIEKLRKRELNRGDREPGTAEFQLERVHGYCEYDLNVDTSDKSASEVAAEICQFVKSRSFSH